MPTIIESYAYPDATVFDKDGHNDNVYSSQSDEGLMSVANGGLEAANLGAGFLAVAEHIFPMSMLFVGHRRNPKTKHFYSDICGDSQGTSYIVIDAVRFRVPFDAGQIRIMATFFASPCLWQNGTNTATISARTQLYWDGQALSETADILPCAGRTNASWVANDNIIGRFATTRTFTQLLIVGTAGISSADLERGDHELSLRLYLRDNPTDNSTVWPATTYDSPATGTLHGRVTTAHVSLAALAFKKQN